MNKSDERGLVMLLHSTIIAIIFYGILMCGLNNDQAKAENRSLLLGAIALAYMIVFGHGTPTMEALNQI